VYGHVLDGAWYDIGDLDSYHRADELMAREEKGALRSFQKGA
jgi:NDP-sugar pyrophosphorylase family protein